MIVYTARPTATEPPSAALHDADASTHVQPSPSEPSKTVLSRALAQNAYRAGIMAITGHDLRQPLHVLSMLLETLMLQLRPAEAAGHAELARRVVRRIADGLEKLARASQFDSEAPEQLAFPVAEVLLPLMTTWRAHALENHVRLRVLPCSAWTCSDPSMLTTILDNLVGNAIKYSAQRRVVVGCRRRGDRLSIRVIDQGIGIRHDHLQRIFDAFHQEDRCAEGMGLGLSIVRLTAAALGHPVDVESVVGRGSIFSVEVPLVRAPFVASKTSDTWRSSGGRSASRQKPAH